MLHFHKNIELVEKYCAMLHFHKKNMLKNIPTYPTIVLLISHSAGPNCKGLKLHQVRLGSKTCANPTCLSLLAVYLFF